MKLVKNCKIHFKSIIKQKGYLLNFLLTAKIKQNAYFSLLSTSNNVYKLFTSVSKIYILLIKYFVRNV